MVGRLREHGAGAVRPRVRVTSRNFRGKAMSRSRMRTLGLAVSMFALGCASAVEADALEVPDAPTTSNNGHDAIVPTADPQLPVAARNVADGPRCKVRDVAPTRAAPIVPPDADAACHAVPRKIARALQAGVRKSWMRRYPTGKLAIAPGCDRLGPPARMDLEQSNGHGGSLNLARFELDAATGDWSVLWIAYSHYADYPGADADVWEADTIGTFEIRGGRITAAVMSSLVERVRAAAVVDPVEHPPPPKKNTLTLGSMGLSSNSFGVALTIVDDAGRGAESFFAGYPGTGDDQAQGVRMELASRPLVELLFDDVFDKTLEVVAADDFGKWFIRERFIALAGALGGDEHVPELLRSVERDPKVVADELRDACAAPR